MGSCKCFCSSCRTWSGSGNFRRRGGPSLWPLHSSCPSTEGPDTHTTSTYPTDTGTVSGGGRGGNHTSSMHACSDDKTPHSQGDTADVVACACCVPGREEKIKGHTRAHTCDLKGSTSRGLRVAGPGCGGVDRNNGLRNGGSVAAVHSSGLAADTMHP